MKTIFITGISRGLGLEMTKHYLDKGFRVIGLSRLFSPELQILSQKYPDLLKWKNIDLSNIDNLEERLNEAFDLDKERIDVFIDNAAIVYKELIHRLCPDKMLEMFTVNTICPIIITKTIIKNFLRHHVSGTIVHISSICAHNSFNGLSMLGASKAAIEIFSQDTAFEYGRFGIRSNTIVIGLLDMGMGLTATPSLSNELKSKSALRSLTDVETVVKTVDFLTDDSSVSITGTLIHVNAGYL